MQRGANTDAINHVIKDQPIAHKTPKAHKQPSRKNR